MIERQAIDTESGGAEVSKRSRLKSGSGGHTDDRTVRPRLRDRVWGVVIPDATGGPHYRVVGPMTREDVRREIERRMNDPTDPPKHESGTAEVAMQKLVCTECGSTTNREPRPLSVPDVKTECTRCGLTVHEYQVDGPVSEVANDV